MRYYDADVTGEPPAVCDCIFNIFNTPQAASKHLKGVVRLQGSEIHGDIGDPLLFHVDQPSKPYKIWASSHEERERWIRAITEETSGNQLQQSGSSSMFHIEL